VVRELDGGRGVAALRVHERQRVMAEREVGGKLDGLLELDQRLVVLAA
jgi:hypothetical protein